MFFVIVVLMVWAPVGVTFYLLKSGYNYGGGRPAREVVPFSCLGLLLGVALLAVFGALTMSVSPAFVVIAAPAAAVFLYCGGLIMERMANAIGINVDKRGRADQLPRLALPWESRSSGEGTG